MSRAGRRDERRARETVGASRAKGSAGMRRGILELEVSYAARRPWVPAPKRIERWARAALDGRRVAGRAMLSVRVVGRAGSQALNDRFRRKSRPTNVLSFRGAGPLPDGARDLGELVICAPLVAAEARAQGKPLAAHWAHLTVHGVLHLLGLDHEAPEEASKMEAIEVQILDRLGFSDPYG
ncbi:MAG TPA: rRNA maturation RNase YbeY [Steroidobacteraceae bacterium]|nr:rRNA maturation RNase YbeY [Steroidobacteraceae bacterium]